MKAFSMSTLEVLRVPLWSFELWIEKRTELAVPGWLYGPTCQAHGDFPTDTSFIWSLIKSQMSAWNFIIYATCPWLSLLCPWLFIVKTMISLVCPISPCLYVLGKSPWLANNNILKSSSESVKMHIHQKWIIHTSIGFVNRIFKIISLLL